MNRFTISNMATAMSGKVSPREIERISERLEIEPSDNLDTVTWESVCVGAVQLLLKRYTSLVDYVVDMNLYVADAVNRRAQIVCFPAYTGLTPFSIAPQSMELAQALAKNPDTGLPDVALLHEALTHMSDYMFEAYYYTMSILAMRHRVYIMAGSTLYFENGVLRHRAFLFSPYGDLVGAQDKLSLNPLERELGLDEGHELGAFETALGPVSILIGEDKDYFELGRIAKNLGVKVLLNPTVYPREYTPVDAALSINMRAQENRIYGVQSTLVGDFDLGFSLEGPACLFGPYELVKNNKNGILTQTSNRPIPEVACGRLEIDKLEMIKNPYTQDRNLDLMDKYIDRLY